MAPLPAATSTATPLSPAELSYLHTSLSLSPPIRPDCRAPLQFRPLTAETEILPTAHGSSRLVWPDGGECIVGVKVEVSPATAAKSRVEVSVEVSGARDDDPLAVFLASLVMDTIGAKLGGRLEIGEKWCWKLYIDCLLLTPPISHPATLLSLATHLALRDTRLPRLVSAVDEDPLFDDDWGESTPLYPEEAAAVGDVPAVTLLVAAVGDNVLFDPTREEMAVADCVIAASVDFDGKLVGIRTLESGSITGEGGGVKRAIIKKILQECKGVAARVFQSLEAIKKAS